MSKKIAAGCDALVLDVKVGNGAFMKNIDDAQKLAQVMMAIGRRAGLRTSAVLSSMNQPMGLAVGNALEVREAIKTLQGKGPADLEELCLEVAAQMVLLAQGEGTREKAMCRMRRALEQGSALEKFQDIIAAQGGDPGVVDNTRLLPEAGMSKIVAAGEKGYVRSLQADEIGKAAMLLGAGRRKKDDPIDFRQESCFNKRWGPGIRE